MFSDCERGGQYLGNRIDRTQAELGRIPNTEHSSYKVLAGIDKKVLIVLAGIFSIDLNAVSGPEENRCKSGATFCPKQSIKVVKGRTSRLR